MNRPIAEGQDERHDDVCDWHEHQQTECPAKTGFGEYFAVDNNRQDGCCQADEDYSEEEDDSKYRCNHFRAGGLHFHSFHFFDGFSVCLSPLADLGLQYISVSAHLQRLNLEISGGGLST